MKKPLNIYIKGGKMIFIYDDALVDFLDEGKSDVIRVSNVEPAEGGWVATMIDGTKLGPYRLRQDALDAEIKYIEERMA